MNRRSPGFTLVELVVTVVVTAAILAAVMQAVVVQQRTYREQMGILNARQTARTALELIGTELREISATGGDIYAVSRDSITFRAFRKVGVVCARPSTNRIEVWELGDKFVNGDSALVFSNPDPEAQPDGSWIPISVQQRDASGTSCTEAWGNYPLTVLQMFSTYSATQVAPGALVRGFVPVTYGRYQINGEWVIGRREGKGPVVPLLGPIEENDGLTFRYFDVNDVNITPLPNDVMDENTRRRIRRIEIAVRARRGDVGTSTVVDSLVTQVALRGNGV